MVPLPFSLPNPTALGRVLVPAITTSGLHDSRIQSTGPPASIDQIRERLRHKPNNTQTQLSEDGSLSPSWKEFGRSLGGTRGWVEDNQRHFPGERPKCKAKQIIQKGSTPNQRGGPADSRSNAEGQNLRATPGRESKEQNPGKFPKLLFIGWLRPWPYATVGRTRSRVMSWLTHGPPIPIRP